MNRQNTELAGRQRASTGRPGHYTVANKLPVIAGDRHAQCQPT